MSFIQLADPGWEIGNRFEKDNGIPTYTLIGPGMEVLIVDGYVEDADIQEVLPY